MNTTVLDTLASTPLDVYPTLEEITNPEQLDIEAEDRLHRVSTSGGILLVKIETDKSAELQELSEQTNSLADIRTLMDATADADFQHWNDQSGLMLGFSRFTTKEHVSITTYPSPELLLHAHQASEFLPRIMGEPFPHAYLGLSGVFTEKSWIGEADPAHWLETQRLGRHPASLPGSISHHHDLGTDDRHYLRTYNYHESVNQQLQAALNSFIATRQRMTDTELRSVQDAAKIGGFPEELGTYYEDVISPGQCMTSHFLQVVWRLALDQDELPSSLHESIEEVSRNQSKALTKLDDFVRKKLKNPQLLAGLQDA